MINNKTHKSFLNKEFYSNNSWIIFSHYQELHLVLWISLQNVQL